MHVVPHIINKVSTDPHNGCYVLAFLTSRIGLTVFIGI